MPNYKPNSIRYLGKSTGCGNVLLVFLNFPPRLCQNFSPHAARKLAWTLAWGLTCVLVACVLWNLVLLVSVLLLPDLHGKSLEQGGAVVHIHAHTDTPTHGSIPADGGFHVVAFLFFSPW